MMGGMDTIIPIVLVAWTAISAFVGYEMGLNRGRHGG